MNICGSEWLHLQETCFTFVFSFSSVCRNTCDVLNRAADVTENIKRINKYIKIKSVAVPNRFKGIKHYAANHIPHVITRRAALLSEPQPPLNQFNNPKNDETRLLFQSLWIDLKLMKDVD